MGAPRLTGPPVLPWEAYAARWAQCHGGVDPRAGGLVGGYLRVAYRAGVPLARRSVPPAAVSVAALLTAYGVPAMCLVGGRWPILAAAIALVSGFLDSVDGAVAIAGRTESPLGGVLDSTADRFADTAYVLALWALGAPGWLVGLAAGLSALQEYLRARAAGAGIGEIGVITVWERPTRVLMCSGLCLGAGILVGAAAVVVTVGAAVSALLAVIGIGQLLVVVRRLL